MNWLLVFLGGMVGAPLRYLTDRAVQSRHGGGFPWGTFTVNVAGCFILGLLTGLTTGVGTPASLFIGTGLCGALTTYSTFSYETLRLAESDSRLTAMANVFGSIAAGIASVYLGNLVA